MDGIPERWSFGVLPPFLPNYDWLKFLKDRRSRPAFKKVVVQPFPFVMILLTNLLASHHGVRQGDQRNSEQMDEQGGSNWPKFEDADWPAGGEDKPSGWAFRTKRQDSHPNLKPPIGST